jgi:DNA polymerase-1
VRVVVAADGAGGGLLAPVDAAGAPVAGVRAVSDLAGAVADAEADAAPGDPVRWVWPATAAVAPALLERGARAGRCHDIGIVEGLLIAHAGHWGEPHQLPAAYARLTGRPVPDDRAAPGGGAGPVQDSLFDDATRPAVATVLDETVAVHADQLRRLATAGADAPGLRLLAAADSAGTLVAAEMSRTGLPWRADVHDGLLTELLGPRPAPGVRPARLTELGQAATAAFGGRPVNLDSPADVQRALRAEGIDVPSTRADELRALDHPAVPILLRHKALSRLFSAHGWAWLSTWVRAGRFRPEWVVGGVVSGRWASRGGGALQIPHELRRAVIADPGHLLVVADAAQLEPRVLAAMAGDDALAAAGASGDLYTSVAAGAFGGDRARAKIGLLSAMYGQTGGSAAHALAQLRRRFPRALDFVERAARTGEAGGLVRSRLGRTCPPPSSSYGTDAGADLADEAAGLRRVRSRGRFTRNFVIQASAADWAAVWLAVLRTCLPAGCELVFFQHDEVIVQCPHELAGEVAERVRAAAATATGLVFGDTPVRFPVSAEAVTCYADADHQPATAAVS